MDCIKDPEAHLEVNILHEEKSESSNAQVNVALDFSTEEDQDEEISEAIVPKDGEPKVEDYDKPIPKRSFMTSVKLKTDSMHHSIKQSLPTYETFQALSQRFGSSLSKRTWNITSGTGKTTPFFNSEETTSPSSSSGIDTGASDQSFDAKRTRKFVSDLRHTNIFNKSLDTSISSSSSRSSKSSCKTPSQDVRTASSIFMDNLQTFGMSFGNRVQTISSTVAKYFSEMSDYVDLIKDSDENTGLTAEDAAKELKNLRELMLPFRERKRRKASLRKRVLKDTDHKWKVRTNFLRLANMSNRLFHISSDSFKIWKPLVRRVEGRFGASGVAYFNFVLDLIKLNLILSLITLVAVFLPVRFFHEEKNENEDPNEWFAGWSYVDNHTFVDGGRCPNVYLSKDNEKINNCSNLYLDQLQQGFNSNNSDNVGNIQYLFSGIAMELLMGKGRLEFTYLFLGYYPAKLDSANYPVAALSVLSTALVFIMSLVAVVLRIGQWLRFNTIHEGALFSKMVFSGYDFSLRLSKAVSSRQRLLRTELRSALNEDEFQQSKASRTPWKRARIYIKRFIVSFVIQVILFITGYAILQFVKLQNTIGDMLATFENLEEWVIMDLIFLVNYSDTVIIWFIGIIVPPILSKLGSYEEFSSRIAMLLYIVRYGFIRLVSLLILVISHLERAGDIAPGSCDVNLLCWETYLAQKLYAQLVWDFITRVVAVVIHLVYSILTMPCLCLKISLLPQFSVPDKVIDILFLQTICWISVPVSPLLPAFSFISLSFLLWLELLTALLFTKAPKLVFQASRSSAMFMMVLVVVWIWAAGLTVAILLHVTPSLGCGPFRGLPRAWDALTYMVCNMDGDLSMVRDFLFTLDNNYIVVPLLTMLLFASIYYILAIHSRSSMIKQLESKIKSIGSDKAFMMSRIQLLKDSQENFK